MRKKISIRAKLFALFSIIFMVSMIFLTYMATRIVIQFGEYSATENETSIKSQASFFLSQVTHEKAMRCENIFERIAVSSAHLARQASVNLDKEHTLGQAPFRKEDILVKAPGSRLYSNSPEDPVMVLYWGEKKLHKGIVSHLNALSHMDPLLENVIDRNPEAVACFITFEVATTRYYPNFPSIIRNLSADAYEIRDSAWYTAVKPENNAQRKTVWSEVYQDPAGRGLMTTAVSPVYDFKDRFIGATGVDVTLVNITDIILASTEKDHNLSTKELFSFIIDDQGRIVAFPREYLGLFGFETTARQKQIGYNALFNLKMSDSEEDNVRQLWQNTRALNRPSQERIHLGDKQLLISSFIMPSTGWRLGVAVPESNLLESIEETRVAMKSMVNTMVLKFGLFALLVMIVSIVGFAILLIKYFIRPLDTLTHAAVKVREGDLSQQVAIERDDEIGILARTFNTMIRELEKLSLKDREHAQQLRQKVRERTVELEKKTVQQEKTLQQLQQEIRDRKEIERRLSRSEEKYRDIFNNSVQGIFQSSQDNKILNANPSMARILGYDNIGEFLTTIKDLSRQVYVKPDERQIFVELLKENDFVSGFETKLKKKDGSHVWVSICGRAIRDGQGSLKYIQGSFEDISERKKAQEIFKRAKQMAEEASRAKSEFLTIMSHEIRTPLNAIIGMTRLTLTTDLTHTQKEYLDAVLISSDHLLTLLNNILDFSKIEAGKFVLENNAFDINSLLNDMMTMFSFQARKKQLDLQYDTGNIPRYVTGDIHRLRQILVNLVGNAIKFTNSGSIAIDVDTSNHDTTKMADDDVELLFSIKDTGVGIPSDKLAAVFNDFTQLDDAGTIEPGGTGLGLTITRQLIHLMDGDIWVESQNGKGSTFRFKIRLKQATEAEAQKVWSRSLDTFSPPPGKQFFTPLDILLAEDFEVNRKLLVPFLTQYGHTVTTAENGQEVLDHLKVRVFDLILMDIKMPVMDGIEATRRIRKNTDPDIRKIPIVALTAHAIKGDRERFLSVGMDEYISKPIQGDELLNILEEISSGRVLKSGQRQGKEAFNLDYAMKLMGGNRDIVDEICRTIIIKFPEEIAKMKSALARKDIETVSIAAHSLKSGAKSIYASEMLTRLEAMGAACRQKDLAEMQISLIGLEKTCKWLMNRLEQALNQDNGV